MWVTLGGFALITLLLFQGCKEETPLSPSPNGQSNTDTTNNTIPSSYVSADFNDDGEINILFIGSSQSIGSQSFDVIPVMQELQNIFKDDSLVVENISLEVLDIFKQKNVTLGLGQAGTEYTWPHFCHSLAQFYYWPENQTEIRAGIKGETKQWDYVVIAPDPYILSTTPGFTALGISKIASIVNIEKTKLMLINVWDKESTDSELELVEEIANRITQNSEVGITNIPAADGWNSLPQELIDQSSTHPSENGAYLIASQIYSALTEVSSSTSKYVNNDEIAEVAYQSVKEQKTKPEIVDPFSQVSPFSSCGSNNNEVNYKHTGTSSERGIQRGLSWVFGKSSRSLVSDGAKNYDFNYGRANTNFEPNKRYEINPSLYTYSMGFPMQDHSNHGDNSMLYGIDKRLSNQENGTDLGVAFYMVNNNEVPQGKAIPIRLLSAQLKEAIEGYSAYGDSWHMNSDLDKASAAFMYTLLTGECVLDDEPTDKSSSDWKSWKAREIGHQTAYTLSTLKGTSISCK